MKDADLFPTICGHHWLPVFTKPSKAKQAADKLRQHLCGTSGNQPLKSSLAQRAGDIPGVRASNLTRHE